MGQGIVVIIASFRRPIELGRWLDHVSRQSVKPLELIWAVTGDADLPSDWATDGAIRPTVVRSPTGLTVQRNHGLAAITSDPALIAFFDDDYVPTSTCFEDVIASFAALPDAVGLTGLMVSDGINSSGIAYDDALALVEVHERQGRVPAGAVTLEPWDGLYGCNMVYRADAIGDERFDENLPLYAWQEDVDFAVRVAKGRSIGRTNGFAGVHQGVKGGRTSGRRFGYSQIVNPVYLYRKGSMKRRKMIVMASKNVIANHVRSFRPESWIDRRGRVVGNWLGILDLIRGKVDPRNALNV